MYLALPRSFGISKQRVGTQVTFSLRPTLCSRTFLPGTLWAKIPRDILICYRMLSLFAEIDTVFPVYAYANTVPCGHIYTHVDMIQLSDVDIHRAGQ